MSTEEFEEILRQAVADTSLAGYARPVTASAPLITVDPYDPIIFNVRGNCASCKASIRITTTDPSKYTAPGLILLCRTCSPNSSRAPGGYASDSDSPVEEASEYTPPACECGSEKAGIPGHSSYCPKYGN